MAISFTTAQIAALSQALSQPRLETYLSACSRDPQLALDLYRWNAEVSGAFMVPLHFCEVAARNSTVGAIERVYGPQWPWSTGFETSLPNGAPFSPRKELQRARRNAAAAGQVVSDLKFAFWVDMLTARHDGRLWTSYLRAQFPNLPVGMTAAAGRNLLRDELDKVRMFRNRIAHHEPVFTRNLALEYDRLRKLMAFCGEDLALWLDTFETVTTILLRRP